KTTGSVRPDLNDTARVYGVAEAGSHAWKVFAGAEQSRVLSSALNLFLRELTVMSFGLIAVLLGTLFVYRRVVRPIHALSRSVEGVRDPATADPMNVSGPSEIAQLAVNFN